MEVDDINIQRQVCKFQRVSSNGSTTTTDNSSNPHKIATNHDGGGGGGGGGGGTGGGIDVVVGGGGGGVARLCGWPSSRIVRVSRASGGKDRHSKVLTSKGLRDRRVRLSVGTAIQFYDLQDRLGYDQPSKAVEWLLKAASSSIDELPSLDLPIPIAGAIPDSHHQHHQHQQMSNENKAQYSNSNNNNNNNVSQAAKSPACSSTSETSKGSGLSLSRSENRIKARERARVLASKKDKEKEIDSTRVSVMNQQVNNISENSSFTDLLTGGINTATATTATIRSPMEYFYNRPVQQQSPQMLYHLPQFNIPADNNNNNSNNNSNNNNNHNNLHHFSFLQDSLNFSMTSPSSSSGGVAPGGYTRGTLQSNLPSSLLTAHNNHNHQYHHLQRFQSSSIDGSNLPFYIFPNSNIDHFPATSGYHLSYGSTGGGGGGDGNKDKAKN